MNEAELLAISEPSAGRMIAIRLANISLSVLFLASLIGIVWALVVVIRRKGLKNVKRKWLIFLPFIGLAICFLIFYAVSFIICCRVGV